MTTGTERGTTTVPMADVIEELELKDRIFQMIVKRHEAIVNHNIPGTSEDDRYFPSSIEISRLIEDYNIVRMRNENTRREHFTQGIQELV